MIVFGVETCGEDLSLRLLRAGVSIVGIEASLIGGECASWAGLPSKFMIRAANFVAEARRADGAVGQSAVTPDWSVIVARLRVKVTGGWDDATGVARFESLGGTVVHGRGRLVGPRTVTVNDQSFTAQRGIVIATGSQPVIPSIAVLNEVDYWTTHDVIRAERLPESIIILGGGAVGCEMGQILARFGVNVTLVQGGDRLLSGEEPEASEVIEAAFANEGIAVRTGSRAERAEQRDGSISVMLSDGETVKA